MTVITVPTVIDLAAVAAMGEADEHHRYELTAQGEVKIMMVASPEHARIVSRLIFWLFRAGFTDEQVRSEMGVFTGGGRQPDLTVWTDRAPREGVVSAYVALDGLLLAVEVISPSSRRNDTFDKVEEYAQAGIERYWTVEQDGTQAVTRYDLHDLGGERRYVAQAPRPLSWLLEQDPHDLLTPR
jgi:Uma2 family endonuclease